MSFSFWICGFICAVTVGHSAGRSSEGRKAQVEYLIFKRVVYTTVGSSPRVGGAARNRSLYFDNISRSGFVIMGFSINNKHIFGILNKYVYLECCLESSTETPAHIAYTSLAHLRSIRKYCLYL